MKRKILILSVLAICIATFAAGTIAFFTAEGKRTMSSPPAAWRSQCRNGRMTKKPSPLKI